MCFDSINSTLLATMYLNKRLKSMSPSLLSLSSVTLRWESFQQHPSKASCRFKRAPSQMRSSPHRKKRPFPAECQSVRKRCCSSGRIGSSSFRDSPNKLTLQNTQR